MTAPAVHLALEEMVLVLVYFVVVDFLQLGVFLLDAREGVLRTDVHNILYFKPCRIDLLVLPLLGLQHLPLY